MEKNTINGLNIRRKVELFTLYDEPQKGIMQNSPELLMMRCIEEGNVEGVADLFPEHKQFSDALPVVDTPYGRFVGREAIGEFAKGFVNRFKADDLTIIPMFQTRSGGRSVTEIVLNFVIDGVIDQVPMFVVADLCAGGKLEEARLYCHASFVPDLTPYRKPMFHSAHLEMGDPGLLTGAMREYYTALHHMPYVDVDRILACMHPDCIFGGYAVDNGRHESDPEAVRKIYEGMATYIPSKVGMRYETLIDDGITGVIEWVHVISDLGRKDLGRIAMSGVSSYMRGEDGRLISIRISDYAGMEKYIDWDKAGITKEEAEKINAVKEFPAGVGYKGQEEL